MGSVPLPQEGIDALAQFRPPHPQSTVGFCGEHKTPGRPATLRDVADLIGSPAATPQAPGDGK